MKDKMITIKVPESRLKWIKDEYKLAKWGVNGLFEYGGIDIKEAHALADILCHVNEVFQIEED
tara:strand:+ start:435 stop:623 length:189 start_codon:yes stop_codon:yes gene_type:complete